VARAVIGQMGQAWDDLPASGVYGRALALTIGTLCQEFTSDAVPQILRWGVWKGPHDPGAPDGWVFTSRTGTLREPRNMSRSFDTACRRAGIKPPKDPAAPRGTRSGVDFHGLRHDFASLLGELHVPQHVAMQMAGHSHE
jgi:integrase